ncbi:MAG: hypothetical protein LBL83_06080 [Clostridiales bacterium]|jgi:hypothetical protein|nr:hypothetical protein [Clostridiales bacterium]
MIFAEAAGRTHLGNLRENISEMREGHEDRVAKLGAKRGRRHEKLIRNSSCRRVFFLAAHFVLLMRNTPQRASNPNMPPFLLKISFIWN